MKKRMVPLLVGLGMAALFAGGCSKEAVKPEEPVVPPVVVEKVAPPKPVEPAKEPEPVKPPEPVKEVQPAPIEPATTSQVSTTAPVEVKLETAYFDFDKSELREDARDILSKNAEAILKSLPGAKIKIEGHCDERGSAEYNLALGEHRAKSVLKYLTTLGVKAENLSIISYGKEKPAVIGSDEAAWAKNRRAEFVVIK